MTTKRDTKGKPKKDKQAKVEKETLKDLSISNPSAEGVKGGSTRIDTLH